MDPSHTRGCVEVSEPLRSQCWWHPDSYSVQGNAKFVSPIYIILYCILILIIRVHHVQKYTKAILPHAALCHS